MKNKYIVNGKELTEEEFENLKINKNVRLKLVEGTTNEYIKLSYLEG